MRRFILLFFGLSTMLIISAQSVVEMQGIDSEIILTDSIQFTPSSALIYIENLLETDNLWREGGVPMKNNLLRLVDHFYEPFDSVGERLSVFNYDSIKLKETAFVLEDTIPLTWLNDTAFIFSTSALTREPFIIQQKIIEAEDNLDIMFRDQLPDVDVLYDSIFTDADTITEVFIDSVFLDSLGIQLYKLINMEVSPPLLGLEPHRAVRFLSDSGNVVYSDTSWAIVANEESPFYIVPNDKFTDSLNTAVDELLLYTLVRDSIPLYINDIDGTKTPFWLSTGSESFIRYWVKNYKNDSITIWVGNPSKNNIAVYLEDDININRMTKQVVNDIPISIAVPGTRLVELKPLKKIPVYWEYDFSTNFAFSQTYLSEYWSKGGVSSVTTLLDIKGSANYTDTQNKTKWLNNGRLKYGSIIADKKGLRKSTDVLEFNSKYNMLWKGKFDFSATFYMKNQIAGGYKYPTDSTSTLVSKFLSPSTFTIGLGTEYKPFKHTQLNFSPFSYKNTFVLDTALVDDYTSHGIEIGKKSKQELGSQIVIINKLNVWDGLEINNSVRLFASYFDKPMSVDMDWEVNLKRQITWFFAVSANFHLIYDRDVKFAVFDDDGIAMTLPDGSALKEPKLQFKEFVGLSFAFNF